MSLKEKAQSLVSRIAVDDGDLGCMSCAIYDTAWVAMVSKHTENGEKWLFPESFQYILDSQQPDGSWPSYAAQSDGILNTAASILALIKHKQRQLQISTPSSDEIGRRIDTGCQSLQNQLNDWDVAASVHVGFEILIPALLRLLEEHQLYFDFASRPLLMSLNRMKLSGFKPEYLYSKHRTTALHSLEAFAGEIEFDKVRHHKDFGAYMGSPSSTAAVLIYSNSWDDESEAYIRRVLRDGAGRGNGGVPSAYPSTYFEITWVLTTLLHGGFDKSDIGESRVEKLTALLKTALEQQNGCIGFAPAVGADVDDTSKSLLALSQFGRPSSTHGLLSEFEGDSHFRTYGGESNPSFTANCNVLVALLAQPDVSSLAPQIEKVTRFLCKTWWESTGSVLDKWNLSIYYPVMLMAEAFASLLEVWDRGDLPSIPVELIRDEVAISLYQAMLRTMLQQNEDGSWGTKKLHEETSYAVLTISKASSLPYLELLQSDIDNAINRAQIFLNSDFTQLSNCLWVEKVSFGSELLLESYKLAALNARSGWWNYSENVKSLIDVPTPNITKFVKFYSRIPLFSALETWKIRAALIEGYMFQPQLRQIRLDIFPRSDMEEDKYFEYIPFTWTSNNVMMHKTFLSTRALKDMMIVSFLNYQADEYMEAVVGRYFGQHQGSVAAIIDEAFRKVKNEANEPTANGYANGHTNGHTNGLTNGHKIEDAPHRSGPTDREAKIRKTSPTSRHEDPSSLDSVQRVLTSFIRFVMTHPAIQASSALSQDRVASELRIFLISHMDQNDDNERFAQQEDNDRLIFKTPHTSFYRWVKSTSADHTSCPYSFAFYSCLLGQERRRAMQASPISKLKSSSEKGDSTDSFPSTQEKYIAESMCRHLATMCRMYNDYGSVARDSDEKNLNSINFPEFLDPSASSSSADSSYGSLSSRNSPVSDDGTYSADMEKEKQEDAKHRLYFVAECEREKWNRDLEILNELAGKNSDSQGVKEQLDVNKKVRLFCNVTDLYGQIYVARDIASRM